MRLIIFMWLSCISVSVHADVIQINSSGFVSQHRLMIAATPQEVWRTLTKDISLWWDPAHTRSNDASILRLDTKVGGCLCEKLESGDFEHLRVITVYENQEIRLRGGLGPLRSMGAAGTMRFKVAGIGEGTRLDYKYAVSGTVDEKTAEEVDQVLLDQLNRLQQHVESK